MTTKEQAHDHMAQVLHFPSHYGRTLDALWDCLMEAEGEIVLRDVEPMLIGLGSYAARILKTLLAAQGANPALQFRVENEKTEVEPHEDPKDTL